jgi:hypothetical protein
MNLFNCRSPYILDINGDSAQVATKLELFIWKIGDTEPSTPTKTIEKTKYSDTQFMNYYNISPFVYDLINTLAEPTFNFAYNVRFKKYYKTTGDWNLLDNQVLVSVNGYNAYNNPNYFLTTAVAVLTNYGSTLDYIYDAIGFMYPTIDFIFDLSATANDIRIRFETLEFVEDHYETFIYDIDYVNDGNMYADRISMIQNATAGTIISTVFTIKDNEDNIFYECTLTPVCESKFTPLSLQFVNRKGGKQQLTLYKNSTKTIEVKASDYNTNTFTEGYPTYDQNLGQKRIFNKNGTTMVKANTGWLNESENINIQDIFLSESLILTSASSDFAYGAVTLKSTSQLMKTHLNEKVINYELEFEVASSLINNVV